MPIDVGDVAASALEKYTQSTPGSIWSVEPMPVDVWMKDSKGLRSFSPSEEQLIALQLAERVLDKKEFDALGWKSPIGKEVSVEVLEWGKGSGKDAICMAILARIAYLLQCMKDPQGYYKMASNTNIEMINVAYSASQALNVFFEPFKKLLAAAPCFRDKYEPYARSIQFQGGIVAYSGHSDQEAAEGKNLIAAILDEISAFRMEMEIKGAKNLRESTHSATGLFNVLRSSAYSRFGELSKLVALSYPRYKGDAIQTLVKEWKDDPSGYASVKATWEVHPYKTRADFEPEFQKNPERAEAMYACNPPDAESPFIKDQAAIDRSFSRVIKQPVDPLGYWQPDFFFDHDKPCAAHIDAAITNDRPAVTISHVDSWIETDSVDSEVARIPIVKVDVVVSFDKFPGEKEFKLSRIRQFLREAMRRGCNLRLVSADQFQSADTLQQIQDWGVEVKRRSVDRDTLCYDTLKELMYDGRLIGYERERVMQELRSLQLIAGLKVDHPPNGSKDEADSLAGSVVGAVEVGFEKRVSAFYDVGYMGIWD